MMAKIMDEPEILLNNIALLEEDIRGLKAN